MERDHDGAVQRPAEASPRDRAHAPSTDVRPATEGDGWCLPGAGPVPAPEPAPADELLALEAAVDAAASAVPSGRTADSRLLLRLSERVHGLVLRELAALEESADHCAGRAVPVGLSTWLQREQHLGDDAARSTVRLALRLDRELPAVRDALVSGETTLEHARAVHTGTAGLDPELVTAAQDALAEVARTSEPAVIRRELRERAHAIDPSLGEDAARRQHERRGFTADRLDGYGVHLRGSVDEQEGAVLLLGLSLAVQADRSVSGDDDGRTLRQRQADVVLGWARQAVAVHGGAADSLANDAHTVRTQLLVSCSPDQLRSAGERLVDDTVPGRVHGQRALDLLTGASPVRPAHLPGLPGTTPLTHGALLRLTCDATVSLVVRQLIASHRAAGDTAGPRCTCRTGRRSDGGRPGMSDVDLLDDAPLGDVARWYHAPRVEPLYVGRSSRTVSGQQFKALVARDRHCVVKGCRQPPVACEAHHVRHWLIGGGSDLDNLVLLCARHHHLHHDQRQDLPTSDGRWITQTGWAHDPPGDPPGHPPGDLAA